MNVIHPKVLLPATLEKDVVEKYCFFVKGKTGKKPV